MQHLAAVVSNFYIDLSFLHIDPVKLGVTICLRQWWHYISSTPSATTSRLIIRKTNCPIRKKRLSTRAGCSAKLGGDAVSHSTYMISFLVYPFSLVMASVTWLRGQGPYHRPKLVYPAGHSNYRLYTAPFALALLRLRNFRKPRRSFERA